MLNSKYNSCEISSLALFGLNRRFISKNDHLPSVCIFNLIVKKNRFSMKVSFQIKDQKQLILIMLLFFCNLQFFKI